MIKTQLGKRGKIFGYVRAITGLSPERAPAFSVEIYCPMLPADRRLQYFSCYEVCDNRELVFVSLLRDALVHALPVELSYDAQRFIISVEMRSRFYYETGDTETMKGKVQSISVEECGLWKENEEVPDHATMIIASNTNVTLILSLQTPEKGTKLAQLRLLHQAYNDDSDVIIRYRTVPTMDGKATVKLIAGVQMTKLHEWMPPTMRDSSIPRPKGTL
jgi:hypothetical protein